MLAIDCRTAHSMKAKAKDTGKIPSGLVMSFSSFTAPFVDFQGM